MQRFLAVAIAVQLVAGGIAAVIGNLPERVETVPVNERALRPGQTEVTGTATLIKSDSAYSETPVAAPITIDKGAATITGALVDGVRVTIAWDGGRPFVLQPVSVGGLHLAFAPVEVTGAGMRWSLDGDLRAFEPGQYRLLTPVAVGAAGLARPRDRVEFRADHETFIRTRNGAATTVPLRELVLAGKGELRLEGALRVRGADDEGAAPSSGVTLSGTWEVVVTPTPEGVLVTALVEQG